MNFPVIFSRNLNKCEIDTNRLRFRFNPIHNQHISTTAINLHEILYGLQKYAKPIKEILLLPVLNYTKKRLNPFQQNRTRSRK